MKYWQTDPDGYLTGEFDADESPLEPGVFLVPGGGVEFGPPVVGADQRARLIGGAWIVELKNPPKTQAELDAEDSAAAKAELAALDLASIRDLRAYIAAKPDAPQTLKDREAAAVLARARVRP